MIGQPVQFTLGRSAYRRRCASRPPTPQGRMNCEHSWRPYVAVIERRLAQYVLLGSYTVAEGEDTDHAEGDMASLGTLRAVIDEIWDRWQEWAVFDPPAKKPQKYRA